MKVATGLAQSHQPSIQLATEAVRIAIARAELSSVNCVLLFLTAELKPFLAEAIKAVASIAKCTQVIGCTASGIFTEEDWVLDCPAAAAMVFGNTIQFALASTNPNQQPLFTLLSANHFQRASNDPNIHRYGSVIGDANGQGCFAIWQNAKGENTEFVEGYFTGIQTAIMVSHGLKILSVPKRIDLAESYDLTTINQISAQQDLQLAYKQASGQDASIPLHAIMAIYADDEASFLTGNFSLSTLISADSASGHVTLAHPLKNGQFMCWAMLDKAMAKQELTASITTMLSQINSPMPVFGLMFSSIGRGPFNDGIDHDLKAITQLIPNMPVLGCYGNGTIAHIHNQNQLLPYSVVLSLFHAP